MTKKLSESPKWRQTPEWRRQVKAVLSLVEKGFDVEKICAITQIEQMTVNRIIEDEEHNNEIIRRSWKEKVPMMRNIIGMSLNGLNETLKELADPEVRRQMIKGANDLATLTKIVESLNILIRLDEGKSTSNVGVVHQHKHSYAETRNVLKELSKVDPVFEYPVALPETPQAVEVLPPVVLEEAEIKND